MDGQRGKSRISASSITDPTCSPGSTDALASDLVVSGKISADLFASTTATDSDWIVKRHRRIPGEVLPADVKMGGYELMIAGDVLRGRYRHDVSKSPHPSCPML